MKLWNDECGAVLSAELVLLMTIIGIGMTVGLKAIQVSITNEMDDVANAFGALNQSYVYAGISNCSATVAGSSAFDVIDECDDRTLDGLNVSLDGTNVPMPESLNY